MGSSKIVFHNNFPNLKNSFLDAPKAALIGPPLPNQPTTLVAKQTVACQNSRATFLISIRKIERRKKDRKKEY
jgi:hypothetical protein